MELPLSVIKGLVGGFRGTVVSGKLPKVKANPAAASIWMLTLAEKKMPDLATFELATRTPEKSPLPGAPTVGATEGHKLMGDRAFVRRFFTVHL